MVLAQLRTKQMNKINVAVRTMCNARNCGTNNMHTTWNGQNTPVTARPAVASMQHSEEKYWDFWIAPGKTR